MLDYVLYFKELQETDQESEEKATQITDNSSGSGSYVLENNKCFLHIEDQFNREIQGVLYFNANFLNGKHEKQINQQLTSVKFSTFLTNL